jgi:hypothetical protein
MNRLKFSKYLTQLVFGIILFTVHRTVGWVADSTGALKFELNTNSTTIGFLNLKIQSNSPKPLTVNVMVNGRKPRLVKYHDSHYISNYKSDTYIA